MEKHFPLHVRSLCEQIVFCARVIAPGEAVAVDNKKWHQQSEAGKSDTSPGSPTARGTRRLRPGCVGRAKRGGEQL